jgi:hypothetical protein
MTTADLIGRTLNAGGARCLDSRPFTAARSVCRTT